MNSRAPSSAAVRMRGAANLGQMAASHTSSRLASCAAALVLLVVLLLGASSSAQARAYFKLPNGLVYKPTRISLGSTGAIRHLRWGNWGRPVAVGRGFAVGSSTAVAGLDGPATVWFSGLRRCDARTVYSVVVYRAFGFKDRVKLGCNAWFHQ